MKKRFLWLIVIIVLAGVGGSLFYFYRFLPSKKKGLETEQTETVVVERGNIINLISASGSLLAGQEAELNFGIAGRIDKINVSEGDPVEKGDILAKLENDEQLLSVLQAENNLANALSALESARVISSRNVIGEKERKVEESRLQLRLKKKNLEKVDLKAPFSGIVSKIYAEEKESVSASGSILRVVNKDKIFAEVNVDEVDITQVKTGQRARIDVDAYPDEVFPGRVVYIASEATKMGGLVVIEVKIELEGSFTQLKPGLTVSTDIIIQEARNVLILPVEAVNEGNGRYFALVPSEEEDSLPREITTGVSDGDFIEIKSGLEEGDLVLSWGLQKIIEMRRQQKEMEEGQLPGGMRMMMPQGQGGQRGGVFTPPH